MTNDELPTDARRKLLAIESARQDAEDAAHAAGRRLQQLNPRSTDPAIGEALQEKRDKHSQRHDELNVLVNRIRQWLRELPPGTALEAASPVRAKPTRTRRSPRPSRAFALTSSHASKTWQQHAMRRYRSPT